MLYRDRLDAGKQLSQALRAYQNREEVLVIGLPRGGVPVAGVVAGEIGAQLEIILVRKLGLPWDPELGFGAVAEGGVRFLDRAVIRMYRLTDQDVDAITERELKEITRRQVAYRGGRAMESVVGKIVIVVDDGVATGGTMIAAVHALRQLGAAKIVIAVPVGPENTMQTLQNEADEVICLYVPESFFAVGAWYQDFAQTTDEEVRAELTRRTKRTEVRV